MESKSLTVPQAAEFLNVSSDVVYVLVHAEDFPSTKVGGQWRIHKDLLAEWFRRRCAEKGTSTF